jgi:hypothetical protein
MIEEAGNKGINEWEIQPLYFAAYRDEIIISSVTSRIN